MMQSYSHDIQNLAQSIAWPKCIIMLVFNYKTHWSESVTEIEIEWRHRNSQMQLEGSQGAWYLHWPAV
jgi:hypothetical protein